MNNQKYCFVHLDASRGIQQEIDLLRRLNLYGEELYSLTNERLTVILGVAKKCEISTLVKEFQYIDILYVKTTKRNFLLGAYRLHKVIRFRAHYRSVLIASNFSIDFLSLLVLKLKNDFKTQISIHGYYSDSSPFFIFLRIFARYADSVRTVSESLEDFVRKSFKVKKSRMVIAPIPVRIPDIDYLMPKKYDIVFVGRLHQERNIDEWLTIVKAASRRLKFLKVAIAGDGEMRSFFESSLFDFDGDLQFDFLGYVPQLEVSTVLSSAKILLSTAKSESYGLSIREAQLLGVQVIARRSEGSEDASRLLEGSLIIYDDVSFAVKEIIRVLTSDTRADVLHLEEFRKSVADQNQSNISNLVKSWLALI